MFHWDKAINLSGPIVLLIIKEPTIASLLPKTDIVKNKQDEIWQVPGVL